MTEEEEVEEEEEGETPHEEDCGKTSSSGYSSSSIESYHRVSPIVVEDEDVEEIEVVKDLRAKHEVVIERCRRLESVVAGLKAENVALKSETEDVDDATLTRPLSVREEVSNTDAVKLGKLCRDCLGPMEQFSPTDLIGEAARKIGSAVVKEVSRP